MAAASRKRWTPSDGSARGSSSAAGHEVNVGTRCNVASSGSIASPTSARSSLSGSESAATNRGWLENGPIDTTTRGTPFRSATM